jgi:two-component system CheB/CheR fusion protein
VDQSALRELPSHTRFVLAPFSQTLGAAFAIMKTSHPNRVLDFPRARDDHWFRDILDALPVAVYTTDAEGRLTYFNQAAVDFAGVEPELGDTLWCGSHKLYTMTGVELAPDDCPMSVSLREGRAIHGAEAQCERPDGTLFPIMAYPTPIFDRHGRVTGAVNMLVDVSERYTTTRALTLTEKRLQTTYDVVSVGIAETDGSGKFLNANQRTVDTTGLTLDELKKLTFYHLCFPEDQKIERENYEKLIRGDILSYTLERQGTFSKERWFRVTTNAVRDDNGLFLYAVRVSTDITDRLKSEDKQKLLLNELNHRVKNTLATIQSIAFQTAKATTEPAEFKKAFEGRLLGISQTHDLLTSSGWEGATLAEVVRAELMPFHGEDTLRWVMSGPSVTLIASAVVPLGMVFHELATNAIKYGALSNEDGRVDVTWNVTKKGPEGRRLKLRWIEFDGPTVQTPTRQGFGSKLFRSLARQLDAELEIEFAPSGVRCLLDIPFDSVTTA